MRIEWPKGVMQNVKWELMNRKLSILSSYIWAAGWGGGPFFGLWHALYKPFRSWWILCFECAARIRETRNLCPVYVPSRKLSNAWNTAELQPKPFLATATDQPTESERALASRCEEIHWIAYHNCKNTYIQWHNFGVRENGRMTMAAANAKWFAGYGARGICCL